MDQKRATSDHGDNANTYFMAEKNAAGVYLDFNQRVRFFLYYIMFYIDSLIIFCKCELRAAEKVSKAYFSF